MHQVCHVHISVGGGKLPLPVRTDPVDTTPEADGTFWGLGDRAQGRNFSVFFCLDIEKNQMTLRHGALEISQHSAVPSIRSGS